MSKFAKIVVSLISILLVSCLFMFSASAQSTDTMTVYVDQANGVDTNDGLSEATAVKTFDAAYVLLNDGLTDNGTGTIVLVSDYTHTFAAQTEKISKSVSSHAFEVVITGKTAGTKLLLHRTAGAGYFYMAGPTTFENLHMGLASGCNQYTMFQGAGVDGKLVIGEGVTTPSSATLRPCLSAASSIKASDAESNAGKALYLEINSGDWKSVYAGTYAHACRGDATLVMNGGSVNKMSVIYNKVFTGNVNFILGGGSIAEFCTSAANSAGTVSGDITTTIKGMYPAKISNYGTVNGNKYMDLNAANVTLPSGSHTFRNVIGGGVLTMDPTSAITVTGTVTGATTIGFAGTPATGTIYVSAPEATADDAFVFEGTTAVVAVANGVKTWTSAGEYVFKGLVLTVKSEKYNVTLYSGLSGSTKVTPTKTVTEDGVVKYYFEGLAAGNYRTNVSRSGYYTINKVHVLTAEQMATETVIDVSTEIRIFNGSSVAGYQSVTVKEFSDAMMAMLTNKESAWYRNYAKYLTTPVFAEGKKHQQTTQEEMEAYIAGLDDTNDHMYVYSIGQSAEGKNIPIVIFSLTDLSGAETLEEAAALIRANEKLTIHYQAQIHGNEPAGGEAALATIGRLDTAEYGDRLLEKMNIYVIPRLNPDGSEDYVRVVPSTGLNGNRDYLMARTVEIQAQHYVYNLFMPELAIDGHEYTVDNANNNQAYKDMMMAGGYNGNSSEEFTKFTEDMILGVIPALKAQGLDFSFYTNITNNNYSVSGTMYAGLRGSVSFLLESRGISFGNHTMDRRVISHLITLETIFEYAYTNTEDVQAASDAERQRIINNGLTYEDSDVLVLAHKKVSDERLSHVTDKYSYLTGQKTGTIDVVPTKHVADTTRVRPTAYVIPAGQEWTQDVLDIMDLHGISYSFYEAGTAINLQKYLGTTAGTTLSEEQAVVFGKGAYVITMNQSGALILTSLMEPDLQNEYFEETDSGNTNIYGNLVQLQVIPNDGAGFPIYRYIHDLNTEGKIDTTEAPKVEYKVYVHSANGLDTNDAYSEAAPAKTIEHAFAQLDTLMANAPEGTAGTVVFLDLYELGDNAYIFPAHDYPVVLTSKTGAEGLAKKYLKDNAWFAFSGDVTLDHMTLWPSGGNDYYFIFANGNNLTVNANVTTKASSQGKYFTISVGAFANSHVGASSTNPLPVNNTLKVLGGTWKYVYGSSYTGNVTGNPQIILENASILGYMPSYAATTNGHITVTMKNTIVRDGVIYLGNANKNDLTNSTVVLQEGVQVNTIYTGSRDAGNVSKNATIVVDGADMTGIEIIRGAKNTTGTVGKNVLAYKSGVIGKIVGYDEVQVFLDGAYHTLNTQITMLSLAPSVTGFGYKAAFTYDDAVSAILDEIGYSLWLTEDRVINRGVDKFQDELSLRIKNFDVENYGSAKVSAKAYIKLVNGLIIETEVVSYSMQDMVELIDTQLIDFAPEKILLVKEMLAKYAAPAKWNIPNLKAYE